MATKPKPGAIWFDNGDQKIIGFLALPPNGAHRHVAIIVVHDWWGLNDWVKKQTEYLSEHGYIALAVDLYRGEVAADASAARKLKRRLPCERAISDLKAAFDYLVARRDVDASHIGSIGWSMGGYFALQLVTHEPRLAACVVNCGKLPESLADIQKINIPVLGHFGALDRGIPPRKVRAFKRTMRSLAKPFDMKIYAGAGHSFANSNNSREYRPELAADAWSRTLAFFARFSELEIRDRDTMRCDPAAQRIV